MAAYEPGPDFTKAVLDAVLAPLPFAARMAVKVIPLSARESATRNALRLAVPMALRAIASSKAPGERVVLTKNGKLTEETQRTLLRRIAAWFVPGKVKNVPSVLQEEIVRLTEDGFGEEAWRLERQEGEIVVAVLGTSFLQVSAETAADMFFDSFDKLKGLKETVLARLRPGA